MLMAGEIRRHESRLSECFERIWAACSDCGIKSAKCGVPSSRTSLKSSSQIRNWKFIQYVLGGRRPRRRGEGEDDQCRPFAAVVLTLPSIDSP